MPGESRSLSPSVGPLMLSLSVTDSSVAMVIGLPARVSPNLGLARLLAGRLRCGGDCWSKFSVDGWVRVGDGGAVVD
jgi:hypothetical protein